MVLLTIHQKAGVRKNLILLALSSVTKAGTAAAQPLNHLGNVRTVPFS